MNNMRKEKLLVLAKAYPEFSKKYGHVLCIAGLTEDEEWRRIFPIPITDFYRDRFSKREWIEYTIKDEKGDYRKESKKINPQSIKRLDVKEDTETIRAIFRREKTSLESLKQQFKKDKTSLGVIMPILNGFTLKERERKSEKEDFIAFNKAFVPIFKQKIPNKWPRYHFRCDKECKGHKIICEDVEAQEPLRKATLKYKDIQDTIFDVVSGKLFDWMKTREPYFIMGTHFLYGTWLILSLIYPEKRIEKLLSEFV